jgi:phenylpropionate dioxygenase-like ring-hydroxylating dioxygenase large terminal subunit
MLSTEDNELLCKVGPDTVGGTLLRHYWMPALMSSELPRPDGDPMRLRLLGENLIAFRDSSGKVGIIQNGCPHRGASLFYGRVEDGGLRCVYHGWKFNTAGKCLEMPLEPPENNFKDKVRARAYPTHEQSGIVWAYMGPRTTPPPLPDLEATRQTETQLTLAMRECNWVQAMEADLDTGHVSYLHWGSIKLQNTRPGSFAYYAIKEPSPRYKVVNTDYGTLYGAFRPAEADTHYWRIGAFLFPFYTMVPVGVLGLQVGVRCYVPLDDQNTMVWNIEPSAARLDAGGRAGRAGGEFPDEKLPPQYPSEYLPNTTDWLGRWRYVQTAQNDFLIDRDLQRTSSYSGIIGTSQQDQGITESMGPLMNRTEEHLGTSDIMIARTRQRLLRAMRALRDSETTPPGVDEPEVYRVRSGGAILPRDVDWLEATAERRLAYAEHPGLAEQSAAY